MGIVNLIFKFFILIITFNIGFNADNNAPFGDVLLHHVTNDTSENYCENSDGKKLSNIQNRSECLSIQGNEWKGGVYLKIPKIFGVDLSITKHVILIWAVSFLVVLLALLGTSRYRNNKNALPSKFSGLFEILIEFVRNDLVIPNIGKGHANRWTPLIATFFLFILISNFLGLIPFLEFLPGGSGTITGNFAVTSALAVITFFAIIIAGTIKHGFLGHWKNMIPGGLPAPVLLILIPVEIMGMFIKPLALILRLGANMTAGHIGMVAIFGLPILIGKPPELGGFGVEIGFVAGFISVVLNTALYFLEMIVCLVQAYVFALLSSVFIGMAIHAEH
ncbi:MAG: ATP synthase F0 subunit A [Candidatus Marinimicrobia bacterium]|nr:ATP synthase F0 subunit A [Candidatus Neomarinimicrobiota bacterium]|tara:strand:- start:327 stop:1328 length:1002 start_codon:yes stop_codon:yes gene_type:complete